MGESAIAMAEQYADRVGKCGHGQIELAVMVQVGGGDGVKRVRAKRIGRPGGKAAIAIAQQNLYVGRRESPVWDSQSQVSLAVAVEVAGGNRICNLRSGKGGRLKRSVAVAQQHRDRRTGRRQVRKTV